MVIVEYPIAGVPCQFLTFFSPDSGRRVQKYRGVGVDGGKSRRVQRCRPGVRAAWSWTRKSNVIPPMVL